MGLRLIAMFSSFWAAVVNPVALAILVSAGQAAAAAVVMPPSPAIMSPAGPTFATNAAFISRRPRRMKFSLAR